jgi:uncharacterized membrane protein YkoI
MSVLLCSGTTLAQAEKSVTKQEAVSIAQQHYPGRVLAVKLKGNSYQVKTLNDNGEVRIIVIDAKTGRVVSGN